MRILVDLDYFLRQTMHKPGSSQLDKRRAQDMAAHQAWTRAEVKMSSSALHVSCLLVDRHFYFGSADPMSYGEEELSQERGFHRAATEQEYSRRPYGTLASFGAASGTRSAWPSDGLCISDRQCTP